MVAVALVDLVASAYDARWEEGGGTLTVPVNRWPLRVLVLAPAVVAAAPELSDTVWLLVYSWSRWLFRCSSLQVSFLTRRGIDPCGHRITLIRDATLPVWFSPTEPSDDELADCGRFDCSGLVSPDEETSDEMALSCCCSDCFGSSSFTSLARKVFRSCFGSLLSGSSSGAIVVDSSLMSVNGSASGTILFERKRGGGCGGAKTDPWKKRLGLEESVDDLSGWWWW